MTTEQHQRYIQDMRAQVQCLRTEAERQRVKDGAPLQHAGDADLDQMREGDLDRLFDETAPQ
jgi:hypothetical protein